MIRILMVDDDPAVCTHLAAVLEQADDVRVVGVEHDGAGAVEAVVRERPDVVLLDLRMPGVDGLAALTRLRALGSPARVVVLTAFDGDDAVARALAAGADGYLLKSTPPRDLVNLVRVVAQGQTVLSQGATRRLLPAVDPGRVALVGALTARERDVLRLVAEGRSNAEIGSTLFLTEATVKGHVSRVLAKTGCANRTQAGLLARSAGLG